MSVGVVAETLCSKFEEEPKFLADELLSRHKIREGLVCATESGRGKGLISPRAQKAVSGRDEVVIIVRRRRFGTVVLRPVFGKSGQVEVLIELVEGCRRKRQ